MMEWPVALDAGLGMVIAHLCACAKSRTTHSKAPEYVWHVLGRFVVHEGSCLDAASLMGHVDA